MSIVSSIILNDNEIETLNRSKVWKKAQGWQRRIDEGHPGKAMDAFQDRLRECNAELQTDYQAIFAARGINLVGVAERVDNPDGSVRLNLITPD